MGEFHKMIQRLSANTVNERWLRDRCAEIAAKADARIAALEAEKAERERQEPVAWVLFDDIFIAPKDMPDDPPNLECMKPLYARPLAIREPTEDDRCVQVIANTGLRADGAP